MENSTFLQMQGISKSYNGTQALLDVDFSAARGEVHAIIGENGAGKTTLVNILNGAVKQDQGNILLEGSPVEISSPHDAQLLGIRAVHQEFSLIPHLSVTENMLMGHMPITGLNWLIDWDEAYQRAEKILNEIGFTNIKVKTPISRLSVSHQQMVEIAKAVAEKPRILILDEPSAVLSQEELKLLFNLIRKLKDESVQVLYISHRLSDVFEIADRITVLKDGEVVDTVPREETSEDQLIKMMVGRTLGEFFPDRRAKPSGEEILRVEGLTQKGAFEDISFTLEKGEILGMFGLVGSGRTQVARCIFGAERPTSGEIYLEGNKCNIQSPQDAVNQGLALVTEDRKRNGLVMSCTIRDNVSLASMDQMSQLIFLNREQQDALVEEKVQQLDIRPPQLGRIIRTLSGGNQQKVVLAKWLLAKAKVLLLDEPTRGVDVATKFEIYRTIRDLADRGVAILFISSELPEILGMADRSLVLREGRLVGRFTRAEATEEKFLASAAGVSQ